MNSVVKKYKDMLREIAEAYHEKDKKRIRLRVEAVAALFQPREPVEPQMCMECGKEAQKAKGLCIKCYYQSRKDILKARRDNEE